MKMRPTCMSCQSDLTGWDGRWFVWCSYLLETLMIGWFDGSVFWKRLLLADLMDLSSSVFFWLIFNSCFAISYSHSRLTRNDTWMRLLSATNMPFNLPLTRKRDKTTVTFVTYSTRGGVLKLYTMPIRCGSVSVWCSTCSTYSEYYDT